MPSSREWIQHVACANPLYDPSWWDCDGNNSTSDNRIAIQLCVEACPVFAQCKAETQANPARYAGTIRHGEAIPTSSAVRKRREHKGRVSE